MAIIPGLLLAALIYYSKNQQLKEQESQHRQRLLDYYCQYVCHFNPSESPSMAKVQGHILPVPLLQFYSHESIRRLCNEEKETAQSGKSNDDFAKKVFLEIKDMKDGKQVPNWD